MSKPRYIVKKRKLIMTEYLIIDTHLGPEHIVGQTNSLKDALVTACMDNEHYESGKKWTPETLIKYMEDDLKGKGGINP